jgi:hypothetical protein
MPCKNAFGTPSFGRASNAVLLVKLPVSIQTAAEAANCLLCVFWSIFNPSLTIKPPKPGGDNAHFASIRARIVSHLARGFSAMFNGESKTAEMSFHAVTAD